MPNLAALFLCLVLFILFTTPITDGDCFWHLATGRWIVEHHMLPTSDPFSFTVTDHNPFRPESQRIPFLLQQYWLGQLALFGSWQLAGNAGIVLLRATIYSGILVFLYFWMRRYNRGILPLVLTALTGLLLTEIPNERPQLFSFIFMPLTLFLLEKGARVDKQRALALFGLPLLMLIWANTHGAYILGVGLILLTLASHLLECLLKRKRPDAPFIAATTAGIIASIISPTGIMAWQEFFHTVSAYSDSIYESLSPWHVAITLHDWHPAYWLYLLLCVVTILMAWRRIALQHLLILLALALLSLTGLRYLIFLLLTTPLLARYLPEIRWNLRLSAVTIGLAVWLGFSGGRDILAFRAASTFPAEAAAFIRQTSPAPQIFNYYDWGGYLPWVVPGLKTFIDGRGLVEELSLLQDKTMNALKWRQTLDDYGINTVIIPGMSETPGNVYPLAEALAAAADWQLVFADDKALVFVRDIAANRKVIADHHLDRRHLQTHLVKLADLLIVKTPEREEYWQTKANALQLLGDRQGALAAYRRVLQLNPRNDWAARMISAGGN